jgi:tRNA1(Val) A37 N6-methylase TrmN6
MPGQDEDLCWLAGDWRILQRTDGHRFSLDDLVTAYTAAAAVAATPPARLLDLGCGIGSVLLWLAWRFPASRAVGVEAQALSASLARRSIAWNGVAERVDVRIGDFRDPAVLAGLGTFDLVTGTPPYFLRGTGLESDLAQKAPARFEHRGGPEDYALAAARALGPAAPLVLCASRGQVGRLGPAAAAAGLALERRRDVIPRAGKPPLFTVAVLRRPDHAGPYREDAPLVVRDEAGRRTEEFSAVRAAMGMPP